MTQEEFDRYLTAERNLDPRRQDINLARAIHGVEKEFGLLIDWDYDHFKFLSQLQYLEYYSNVMEKNRKKK